jgi:hypothetical protein
MPEDEGYRERLERLGGEPAPVITPEEFARLQRQGQVNIDARGRVRTTRRSDAEAGVSLRKRRAWYSPAVNFNERTRGFSPLLQPLALMP